MGFILFIIASILTWTLAPFLWIYGLIRSAFDGTFSDYNENIAIAKDQYGNAIGKYAFNNLLITKEGYRFGNHLQTISSVLNQNKSLGTLTRFGRLIAWILMHIFHDPAFN
jgi:hypothetical protein